MKLTSHQKQFCFSIPLFVVGLIGVFFGFPKVLGAIFAPAMIMGAVWTFTLIFAVVLDTKFGKWLSEDDK